MKKIISILLSLVIIAGLFTGISLNNNSSSSISAAQAVVVTETDATEEITTDTTLTATEEDDISDSDVALTLQEQVDKAISKSYPDESEEVDTIINLSGLEVSINGKGAEVEDDVLTISKGGTYALTGTYTGQIRVDAGDDDVQLILAGVTLLNASTSPIFIAQADETTITLKSGTDNYITDTGAYQEDSDTEEKTNAAIYAKDDLAINGQGALTIIAKDKSGIIGKDDVLILSGTLNITAQHNGIKGKDLLYVGGGTLEISAETDGLESQTLVYIDGGNTSVLNAYEGIEALDIIIESGNVFINASDDGVNISGESDATTDQPAFGGGMGGENLVGHGLTINGGNLVVYSEGDGLDSNGSMWMNGGTVYVYGPTMNRDGSLDYNGTFEMTGGTLVAAGSIGMVQTPGAESTTKTLSIGLDQMYAAGTLVTVTDASGKTLLEFEGQKSFQHIVVSMPDLVDGGTYTVSVDGEVLGTATISETITSVGTAATGMEGGRGGHGTRPGADRQPPSGQQPPEGFTPPEGFEPTEGAIPMAVPVSELPAEAESSQLEG